jgi:hypothetical protein
MDNSGYFGKLTPDIIGLISRQLQPKYQSQWKKSGKSMKQLLESNRNINTNIVNLSKNDDIIIFKYQSKDLKFELNIPKSSFITNYVTLTPIQDFLEHNRILSAEISNGTIKYVDTEISISNTNTIYFKNPIFQITTKNLNYIYMEMYYENDNMYINLFSNHDLRSPDESNFKFVMDLNQWLPALNELRLNERKSDDTEFW